MAETNAIAENCLPGFAEDTADESCDFTKTLTNKV